MVLDEMLVAALEAHEPAQGHCWDRSGQGERQIVEGGFGDP